MKKFWKWLTKKLIDKCLRLGCTFKDLGIVENTKESDAITVDGGAI